jgi:peroxiredoxin
LPPSREATMNRARDMLRVGDPAPPFVARDTQGRPVDLTALRGGIVVVYFFRKAFTPNCTVETKGFRDNYPELKQLGAEVIGVSDDRLETQCRFQTTLEVSFPMIADADGAISSLYQVYFPLVRISHRVTYVVDRTGVVCGVFNHEFAVVRHLDEVVRFVRTLDAG